MHPWQIAALILFCACGSRPQVKGQHPPRPLSPVSAAVPATSSADAVAPASPSHQTRIATLDAGAPLWWATTDDDTRLVLLVSGQYVVLSLPDLHELARVDTGARPADRLAAFSSRAGILAWVASDGGLRVWNVRSGGPAETVTLSRPIGHPSVTTFAPSGETLAVSDSSGILVVDLVQHQLRSSAPRPPLPSPFRITPEELPGTPQRLEFGADGAVLLASWAYVGTSAYATSSGRRIADLGRGERWVGWGDEEGRLSLLAWTRWPSPGAVERLTLPKVSRKMLWGTAVCRSVPVAAPKGTLMACGTKALEVKVFDVTKGNVVSTVTLENEPANVAAYRAQPARSWAEQPRFTPDGTGLLVPLGREGGSPLADPHTRLYRVAGGELISDLGRVIVLGEAADGQLFLLDSGKQELITIAPGPMVRRVPLASPTATEPTFPASDAFTSKRTATVARDGSRLALVCNERLYLIRPEDGSMTLLEGAPVFPARNDHPATISYLRLSFSHDGRLLLGIMREHAASIWETSEGRLVFRASSGITVSDIAN